MIHIDARKKSTDPVQEELRQKKEVWNKQVSKFVEDFIQYKKLINGAPSKFHMEKSKITEPMPAEAVTVLQALVESFRELASKDYDIMKAQQEYAKTRRKKQPTASEDYDLVAEGSGRLSRTLSRLKPSFSESGKKRARMSLLSLVLDIFRLCASFEKELVSSDKDCVDKSNKILIQIEDALISLSGSIEANAKHLGIALPEKKEDEAKTIINDFATAKPLLKETLDKLLVSQFLNKVLLFGKEKNRLAKSNLALEVISAYNELLANANSKLGIAAKSLIEVADHVNQENISAAALSAESIAAQSAIDDFQASSSSLLNLDKALINKFIVAGTEFGSLPDFAQKNKYAKIVLGVYRELLNDVFTKTGTSFNTLQDYVNSLAGPDPISDSNPADDLNNLDGLIISTAQHAVKRWLGKTKHKLSLFDQTSSLKLAAYNDMETVRKNLNDIMDSLEKEFNITYLIDKMNLVFESFFNAKNSLSILMPVDKYTDTSLSMLSDKNVEHLNKNIQRKRNRELVDRLSGVPR